MATVVVTGSTGLIGTALVTALRTDGHTVRRLLRRPVPEGSPDLRWDPDRGRIDRDGLEGADAVVHLAAEPIGASRGRDARARILRSRRDATHLLAETLAGLERPPRVLVSASAVGYYGDRGDEVLTEESGPGDDFLARVCVEWEAAADPAREAGIRVVHPRTGVVVAEHGPLMDKVRLPFSLGLGGRIGSGRQYVPWIALEDEVCALQWLLEHDLQGPVNLVAPTVATNRDLTAALGAAMHRPTVLPIPPLAVRLLYGELGASLATVSQCVVPRRLLDAGFEFRQPDLSAAVAGALSR